MKGQGIMTENELIQQMENDAGSNLDSFTETHFDNWLRVTVFKEDRETVRSNIMKALADNPGLIDNGYSWPEIRLMAEGS